MVAEVCSIYLRRASGDLELFATEGLSQNAVHVTRLRRGEGRPGFVEPQRQRAQTPAAQRGAGNKNNQDVPGEDRAAGDGQGGTSDGKTTGPPPKLWRAQGGEGGI